MSEATVRHPMTLQPLVCEVPGDREVTMTRNLEFVAADGNQLLMDIYRPAGAAGRPLPAVILVAGFPDGGHERKLGCKFKDTQSNTSWARLIAATGLVAITYSNREPKADLHALCTHLDRYGTDLGVQPSKIGVWASSGNVPLALSLLMRDDGEAVRAAALLYGFTLDSGGRCGVAEASRTWGFVNAAAGKSVDDLAVDVPIFIGRAGRDQFIGLNDALDEFVGRALARNLPITVVNHADGAHAFDLFDDSDTSRQVIRQTVSFLAFTLR